VKPIVSIPEFLIRLCHCSRCLVMSSAPCDQHRCFFVPFKRSESSASIWSRKKSQENIERSLLCSTVVFILKLFNADEKESDMESLHQERATKLPVYLLKLLAVSKIQLKLEKCEKICK